MRNNYLVFWNVDTQYDFMAPDGKLAIKDAMEISPMLRSLTLQAALNDITVVNTADYHTNESEELSSNPDFVSTFPPHCMHDTAGAEYIMETQPHNGTYIVDWDGPGIDEKVMKEHRNIVVRKDKFDVFSGSPYTNQIVEALRPQAAVVYGVATDVCVDFAVKGLLERGVKVYIPTDAIKELPIKPLEETLAEWEDLGAHLVKTTDISELVRQYK